MIKETEKSIQKACLDLLGAYKIFCWRNNTGAVKMEKRFFRFGLAGSPDIIALHPRTGKFIGIEVKGPKGRLSDKQKEFAESVRKNNGTYMVVWSVDQLIDNLKAEAIIK